MNIPIHLTHYRTRATTIPIHRTDETTSTNEWIKTLGDSGDCVAVAEFQTDGHGCGSNHWESERGKNLLFSLLLHPDNILPSQQYRLSMAVTVALTDVLQAYAEGITIKWPNDIYWRDRKLAGMLIENTLTSNRIKASVIGIGLNVNQRQFRSDAPNPVSLWQITGHQIDRNQLLQKFLDCIYETLEQPADTIADRYRERLYRRTGFHPYTDADGGFEAEIIDVETSGHIVLKDRNGSLRRYAFKEITFVHNQNQS